MWRSYYTARANGFSPATSECSLLLARRQATASAKDAQRYDIQSSSPVRCTTKSCDRSRSVVAARRRKLMKTMWEDDPTELLGLEEDEGTNELNGSEYEDEEEEPTELMGLGDQEGEDEDDSGYDEEEEPTEMYSMDEEDEYEDDGEETPEAGQRIQGGLRVAQGLRARRRGRLLTIAAIRHRRRARLLGIAALKRRRRARLFALMALRNRKRARLLGIAAIRSRRRAKAFAVAAIRLRRRVKFLKKAAVGGRLRAAS
jgi:hypothetical protein